MTSARNRAVPWYCRVLSSVVAQSRQRAPGRQRKDKCAVRWASVVFWFYAAGAAVLIALRVYLQIYIEHGDRLDRLARSVPAVRAPTLVPLQNALIRLFSGLIFYLLLPAAMLLFAWKAAVFPAWGFCLFAVATAIIASHVMLPFSRFSWRSRGVLSVGAAIIAGGVMLGFGPPHRPFDLFRANLSGQWLFGEYLRKANLGDANLRDAILAAAILKAPT